LATFCFLFKHANVDPGRAGAAVRLHSDTNKGRRAKITVFNVVQEAIQLSDVNEPFPAAVLTLPLSLTPLVGSYRWGSRRRVSFSI
jgi:hypothetical protein